MFAEKMNAISSQKGVENHYHTSLENTVEQNYIKKVTLCMSSFLQRPVAQKYLQSADSQSP